MTRLFIFLIYSVLCDTILTQLLFNQHSEQNFHIYSDVGDVDPCGAGKSCGNCQFIKDGDKCMIDRQIPVYYCNGNTSKILQNESAFLLCNENGYLETHYCFAGSYFKEGYGCDDPTKSFFKHGSVTGSGRVASSCRFNTDCLGGMYCSSTGTCTCMSTYVMIDSYCYEKINPNSPGCTHTEQCRAVWPNTKCEMYLGVGTCRCPDKTHMARETRDGFVCISMIDSVNNDGIPNEHLHFICPLPENAGFKVALSDPNPIYDGMPVSCTAESTLTTEPNPKLKGGGGVIWPSSGEYVGDIYDCIHTTPLIKLAQKFPVSNFNPTANGVACPSRNFACIQPKATGPNPNEARWYWNSISSSCSQFMYDSASPVSAHHSPNNFKSIEACESYCMDTCKRGNPEYSKPLSLLTSRPVTSCGHSVTCSHDFQCSSITGSMNLCCPSVSSICGINGGRQITPTFIRSTVYHPGFLTKTGKEQIRYYYDATTFKCNSFIYLGQGGNYNNWLSKSACEMGCQLLQCEVGSPLKIGEDFQRCQSNSFCPSTHECKVDKSVCCPKKQTVCSQPKRVGDCTETIKRYWYNKKTKACESFDYTGCQSNDNNFPSHAHCNSFCTNIYIEVRCPHGIAYKDSHGEFLQCSQGTAATIPQNYEKYFDGNTCGYCPTKQFTCSLNADPGIQCGNGNTIRFFYDQNANHGQGGCSSFHYLGCDGNSNSFPSAQKCEEYCNFGFECPNGGSVLRDHRNEILTCSENQRCSNDSYECVNGFCCLSKAAICSLPIQKGTEICTEQPLTRYFYNFLTNKCQEFSLQCGSEGNLNNFATLQDCNSFCFSSSCEAGTVIYMDPNTHTPYECNENLKNSCPFNHQCSPNKLLGKSVCCGVPQALTTDVCGESENPFIDAIDMNPKECLINNELSCPANYLCRFSPPRSKYYCCKSKKVHASCPNGKFMFKDKSDQVIKCIVGKTVCPDKFSCQSTLNGAIQGFCCSTQNICQGDSEFLIDSTSHQPRICTLDSNSHIGCPSNYVCKTASAEDSTGFCCKGQAEIAISDGCPPGEYAYQSEKDGSTVLCDPFNFQDLRIVPDNYACQWSILNQRYQFCGRKPMSIPKKKQDDGCSPNQIAFLDGDTVRTCSAGSNKCPVGFFCLYSSLNSQFQCCGVRASCPHNSVAFVGLSGDPQTCILGQSSCPPNFSCTKTLSKHQFVCCSNALTQLDCKENEILADGQCLNLVENGEYCISNLQCNKGSICLGEKCVCPKSTSMVEGHCQQIPECQDYQVLIDKTCYNKVQFQIGKCISHRQCPSTTYCISNVCTCRRGEVMHPKTESCVKQEEPPKKPTNKSKGKRKVRKYKPKNPPISISEIIDLPLPELNPIIDTCFNKQLTPFRHFKTGKIQYCSPLTNTCTANSVCSLNGARTSFICCMNGVSQTIVDTNVCPNKRIPYLLNGKVKECGKGGNCAHGFQCIYAANSKYLCCSRQGDNSEIRGGTSPLLVDKCLHGLPLLTQNSKVPTSCNPYRNNCPTTYTCLKSSTSTAYICCSRKDRSTDDSFRHRSPTYH